MESFYIVDEKNIASKIIDQEAIAINLVTGDYFSFSGCASVIWQALMGGVSAAGLVTAVESSFDDIPVTAPQQISAFLNRLVEEKLVTAMPAGAPAPSLVHASAARAPYAEPGLDKFDDMAMMLALDPPMPDLPSHVVDRVSAKKL